MAPLKYSIAPAVAATKPPPIPKAQAWADTYSSSSSRSTSDPLLVLSQGVPRSAPHPSVLEALSRTSSDPAAARYGLILGEPSFRSGVAEEVRAQYDLQRDLVTGQDVGITTGCNMAFLVLLMTLCPPGSSVLLPLPSYFNHTMSLSLQSLNPVYIPGDPARHFAPSIDAARAYLSAQGNGDPRMISLVTPNNPTGAVYSPEELKEWYDLAKEFKVALVLDETYRDFVVDGHGRAGGVPHRLFEEEDWRGTLISLGSFSSVWSLRRMGEVLMEMRAEGYRIPGHRLGMIIASPDLLDSIATICDCMQVSDHPSLHFVMLNPRPEQICPPRPPQLALTPLLPSLRTDLLASSSQLAHRRQLFTTTINAVPGWSVISSGGYFAYVQFPDHYLTINKGKRLGSEEVAKILAEKCGVVVLPGGFFMPDVGDDGVWRRVVGGEVLREDKWLRFAVANVDDEVVLQLRPRLRKMNEIMGMSE